MAVLTPEIALSMHLCIYLQVLLQWKDGKYEEARLSSYRANQLNAAAILVGVIIMVSFGIVLGVLYTRRD